MKKFKKIASAPTPSPRAVKLETARDCRKFLSRLINKAYRDDIDSAKAGRIGYLVGIFIKSIETCEMEKRMEALEFRIRGKI